MNSRHLRLLAFLITLSLGFLMLGQAQEISRSEIQRFFTTEPGNSTRSARWATLYQGQRIAWQGMVYDIKHRPSSHRVEILIKVLPDSLLYDTIVVLEGDTQVDPSIRKNTLVEFEGRIIYGIDVVGVKQVQVLAPTPSAIRPVQAGLPTED
jgi:hypothetical protein